MKVSIITVVYNCKKTIRQAIESVLSQTYPNIEYIVVDGNSTDGTMDIVCSSLTHTQAIWISEPDKGIYDAMNKGISLATGDIIGFLNADDFYANGSIISQVVHVFQEKEVASVYGDLVYVDAANTNRITRYWRSGNYYKNAFLKGWMPPHPTFFVKKEVFERYKKFDLRLKSAADYELMLRYIHKYKISIAYLPEVMVLMRTGGVSNANLSNRFRANQEDRLAWKYNGLKPNFLTLFLKPLRKIEQYLFASYKAPVSVRQYSMAESYATMQTAIGQ